MKEPIGEDEAQAFRRALLEWYDREGRTLPWRLRDGNRPDPYATWLSEVMLQQTTVAHATPYWRKFLEAYPTVCDLAHAPRDEVLGAWAGLGYYARARNLHACAQVVCDELSGVFPVSEVELLKLPGVGPYTAAAIAAICGGEATNVVDGNVERVVSRLFAVKDALPRARKRLRDLAGQLVRPERAGDYPQALMDLGATVCRPRNPACETCPVQAHCQAYQEGDPETYPRKAAKTKLPTRHGLAFVMIENGKVWLVRRPDSGMLGGTLGFPTTHWEAEPDVPHGEGVVATVAHTFSHFHLSLGVVQSEQSPSGEGAWYPVSQIANLPTLMQKVWRALS